jgi:NADH-quinone oxidoreductase subunit J
MPRRLTARCYRNPLPVREIETILFYGFATMAVMSAIAILVSRNIVRTAIWLLSTLVAAAGLYFLLGATFVGAIQLIVYTGGTLVLIVFGVMLTAKNPRITYFPKRAEIIAGMVLCTVLACALIWICLGTTWHQSHIPDDPALVAQLPPQDKARLTDLHGDGTANLGNQLLSTYLVPFEVLSLLLLAVLIGAAYLARPRVPIAHAHSAGAEGGPPRPAIPSARPPAAKPDAQGETPSQGGAS